MKTSACYCLYCHLSKQVLVIVSTAIFQNKCLLLSLLPSVRQFNDDEKFLARMEILKIMRHVKLQQNLDTHSTCSLPTFSNANSFPSNSSRFASNPLNPQPITSTQNSEILSRYLSSYSVDPQGHQLPQLSSPIVITVPALSPVTHLSFQVKTGVVTSLLSICLFNSASVSLISFFIFLYKFCDFGCISISYRE